MAEGAKYLVASPPNIETHFTATKINRLLGRTGRFWQQDGFDHLVRSQEQYEYLRKYIANNPVQAGLKPGEFVHYAKV